MLQHLWPWILLIALPPLVAAAWVWRGWQRAMRLPAMTPARYIAAGRLRGDGPVVVCAGDSLTHGHVSASFVDRLRERLGPRGFTFVNAGVNGELCFNLLQRVGEIVACEPDVITVLIGSNDITASLVPNKAERAVNQMGLPAAPDAERYRAWLTELVERLSSATDARIALLSPPPVGEDPAHPLTARAREFAAVVEDVAAATGVTYVPLHEALGEVIERERGDRQPAPYDERDVLILEAILAHQLLGRSHDEIARRNGYVLLTDALHLSDRAADVVADHVERFIAG